MQGGGREGNVLLREVSAGFRDVHRMVSETFKLIDDLIVFVEDLDVLLRLKLSGECRKVFA